MTLSDTVYRSSQAKLCRALSDCRTVGLSDAADCRTGAQCGPSGPCGPCASVCVRVVRVVRVGPCGSVLVRVVRVGPCGSVCVRVVRVVSFLCVQVVPGRVKQCSQQGFLSH